MAERSYISMYIHESQYSIPVTDVFEVLADPTRRRILELLGAHEHSVGELAGEFDIHQPGVSRHLRILHDAGLVDVRKDAQRRIYSIRPEPLRELDHWVGQYRALWEQRFDKLADHLERRKQELAAQPDDIRYAKGAQK